MNTVTPSYSVRGCLCPFSADRWGEKKESFYTNTEFLIECGEQMKRWLRSEKEYAERQAHLMRIEHIQSLERWKQTNSVRNFLRVLAEEKNLREEKEFIFCSATSCVEWIDNFEKLVSTKGTSRERVLAFLRHSFDVETAVRDLKFDFVVMDGLDESLLDFIFGSRDFTVTVSFSCESLIPVQATVEFIRTQISGPPISECSLFILWIFQLMFHSDDSRTFVKPMFVFWLKEMERIATLDHNVTSLVDVFEKTIKPLRGHVTKTDSHFDWTSAILGNWGYWQFIGCGYTVFYNGTRPLWVKNALMDGANEDTLPSVWSLLRASALDSFIVVPYRPCKDGSGKDFIIDVDQTELAEATSNVWACVLSRAMMCIPSMLDDDTLSLSGFHYAKTDSTTWTRLPSSEKASSFLHNVVFGHERMQRETSSSLSGRDPFDVTIEMPEGVIIRCKYVDGDDSDTIIPGVILKSFPVCGVESIHKVIKILRRVSTFNRLLKSCFLQTGAPTPGRPDEDGDKPQISVVAEIGLDVEKCSICVSFVHPVQKCSCAISVFVEENGEIDVSSMLSRQVEVGMREDFSKYIASCLLRVQSIPVALWKAVEHPLFNTTG
eukprot:TRINITY_DN625_c1_g1_i1.p1 TRINITY_DN625_c1_g1~~TRINITY_DN625_c1_g1_i1.p1  ORF type:complete len:689 (+),score=164.80 TRINITY_DN625_c1_g1_i1:254-2068(+)